MCFIFVVGKNFANVVGVDGCIILVGLLSWNVHLVVPRCYRYRYGQGFNDRPFTFVCSSSIKSRSEKYLFWNTYFLEQTCSVISNSFVSFFKPSLLPWHVPYIFMTPLLISKAHFFHFCNTYLFLKFRNSSGVAQRNCYMFHQICPHKTQHFKVFP